MKIWKEKIKMKNLEDYYLLDLNNEILTDLDEDQGSPFIEFLTLGSVSNIDFLKQQFELLRRDLDSSQLLNFKEPTVDPQLFTHFWKTQEGNLNWSPPLFCQQLRPIKYLISDKVIASELESLIDKAAGGHLKKRHKDFHDRAALMNDMLIVINILREDIKRQLNQTSWHDHLLDVLETNSFYRHLKKEYDRFSGMAEGHKGTGKIKISEAIRFQYKRSTIKEDYSDELKKIEGLWGQDLMVEINFKKPNKRSAYSITFKKSKETKQIIDVIFNHYNWKQYFLDDGLPNVDEKEFLRDWLNKLSRFIADKNVSVNENFNISKNQAIAVGIPFVILNFGKAPDPEYKGKSSKSYAERLSEWVTTASGWSAT
jgi:hypothetical protein